MNFLEKLFGAEWKKFVAMVAGSSAVVGQDALGMTDTQLTVFAAIVVAGILGQGIADFGKGRAVVEAKNGGAPKP